MIFAQKYLPWLPFLILIFLGQSVGASDFAGEPDLGGAAPKIRKFSAVKWSAFEESCIRIQTNLAKPTLFKTSVGTTLTILGAVTFFTALNNQIEYNNKLASTQSEIRFAERGLSKGDLPSLKKEALKLSIMTKGINFLIPTSGALTLTTFYLTPTIPMAIKIAVTTVFGVVGGLGFGILKMMDA